MLKQLAYFIKDETYLKNQPLYSEGESLRGVYIVWEGEFEVSMTTDMKKRDHLLVSQGLDFEL